MTITIFFLINVRTPCNENTIRIMYCSFNLPSFGGRYKCVCCKKKVCMIASIHGHLWHHHCANASYEYSMNKEENLPYVESNLIHIKIATIDVFVIFPFQWLLLGKGWKNCLLFFLEDKFISYIWRETMRCKKGRVIYLTPFGSNSNFLIVIPMIYELCVHMLIEMETMFTWY